jgi:cell division protein FtsI/penicillin-binding protein 2
LYFPGSSFKILTAAAGIDEQVDGGVTCRNGRNAEPITWAYGGKSWRRNPGQISDYSDGGHGSMRLSESMDRAMTASCNVYFAKLAAELGPERLHRAMERAELHRVPTTAELAEHLPYSGFGQIDVKCSPLEMAMLAGAAGVARDEQPDTPAARPHWVQAVVRENKKRQPEGIAGAPNREAYRPFPAEVASRVRQMMVQVVQDPSGTAHAAFYRGGAPRLPGITVGGKTGTAEFEKKGKRDGRTRTSIGRHAWFVGFARSDHEVQPRTLAFAVLVEDVRRGGTGGRVCAPVARDLIAKVLPPPGAEQPGLPGMLDRFYRERLRPSMGPFGPIIDWFRERFRR